VVESSIHAVEDNRKEKITGEGLKRERKRLMNNLRLMTEFIGPEGCHLV